MDYVWDRTTEFLGDRLSAVLPPAILGILVPTAIMNALSPLWATTTGGSRAVVAIVMLAMVVALFWGSLAITALTIDPAGRAGATASRRLLPTLGVYALLMLAAVALFVPIGILAALAGIDPAAMQAGQPKPLASPAMGLALMLYVLAMLAGFLVCAARLMPVAAVIVAERRGAGAIARAWRLTRGLTWRLIGVAILYFVVSQVAALAARTVFGSIVRLIFGDEGAIGPGTVVTGVIVAAVSAAFTTIAAVFAAKLYIAIQRDAAPVPVDQDMARA